MTLRTGTPRYVDIYTIIVDNTIVGWSESYATICEALQAFADVKKEIRITKQKRLLQ